MQMWEVDPRPDRRSGSPWRLPAAMFVLLAGLSTARAADPGKAYLEGLDALSASQWRQAADRFSQAVDTDPDNSEYRLARGVARTLDQQLAAAMQDLQKASQMQPSHWETRLWLSAAMRMSNDPAGAARTYLSGRGDDRDYGTLVDTMGQTYWQSRYQGRYYDPSSGRTVPASGPVTTDFPRAAALFVERHRRQSGAAVGAALLERAKTRLAQGDAAGALEDYQSLLATSSDDPELRQGQAACMLALGDLIGVRSVTTRLLTEPQASAADYLVRAQAAARMADAARMESDLAAAQRRDPAGQAQAESIRKQLAAAPAESPQALLEQLRRDAAAGVAWDRLVEQASNMRRAADLHRRRDDERYQDRLRVLSDSLADRPNDPDRIAALARFLVDEATVLSEQVDPRDVMRYYRYQPPNGSQLEIDRARTMATAGLDAHSNSASLMGVLASIQILDHKFDDAAATLRRALAIKPNDGDLLEMMARVLSASAQRKASTAADLRRPQTWWENRWDLYPPGEWMFTRYPSQADLQQADALDRQAADLNSLAMQRLEAASRVNAGTARGAYYLGCRLRASGDLQAARTAIAQAVKLQPDYQAAWFQLAGICTQLSLGEEAVLARSNAVNLSQTTAAPWLVSARFKIMHAQSAAARDALTKAETLDPADARIRAWLGVIDTTASKPDDATGNFMVALALEEARARLHGRTLQGGCRLPVDGDDIGLTLSVRIRLAALNLEHGRTEAAEQLFRTNVAFLKTVPDSRQTQDVPASILPSATPPPAGLVPLADNWGLLMARSQGGLDYVAWTRRNPRAEDRALAASTYRRLLVDFNLTDTRPEPVAAVVGLGLAELEVSKANFEQADRWLANRGATPQPLWQEMRQVEAQIRARRSGASTVGAAADPRRVATLQRLRSEKQALEQQVAIPGMTEAGRAQLRERIDRLDREIRELEGRP